MQLFYDPNINNDASVYNLNEQESIHASKVLRKTVGDKLHITNGKGDLFETEVISITKKKCSVRILQKIKENNQEHKFTIAIAPTKNINRIEWFIEKAVEIGIKDIKLFVSQNSERRVVKEERLQLKALSAMKQSLKTYLPGVSKLQKLEHFLKNESSNYNIKLIAYCKEEVEQFAKYISENKSTILLIGPEGGFSENEVALAEQFGFKAVSLGSSRLRTETAAIYATSVFNALTL